MGGQASWLLPAALIALLAGLWSRHGTPRTDRKRAALLLWGGWLLVTAAIFSFSEGVIHTYYTVALAPAVGALVAIGAALSWERRDRLQARALAALAVAASGGWAYALLERTPAWLPWLGPLVLAGAVLSVLALLLLPAHVQRRAGVSFALALLAAVAMLAGPLAYAADTVTTPHTGSLPSAGPQNANVLAGGARGGGPPGAGAGAGAGAPGGAPPGQSGHAQASGPALFGSGAPASGAGRR